MVENILLHLKHKIESLLFSAARRLTIEEIKKHARANEEDIYKCLKDYQKELEEKGGSIQLIQEGDTWQLTVREQYIPVIKKIVTQTEMPKTIVETLAVVAYKAPVLQSFVIKLRTNKGYRHLEYLEKEGFITREKKGRTKLIKLTPKFYDYFNLDPRQLREALKPKIQPYGKKEPEKPKEEKKDEKTVKMTEEQKKVNEKVKELLGIKQEKPEKSIQNETR